MPILHIIGAIFIIFGTINFAVCASGMLYFRDVYARISVLGTTSGFGVTFVLLGVVLYDPTWRNVILCVAAIVILLGTSSMGTLLVARSALLRRTAVVGAVYNEADVLQSEVPAPEGVDAEEVKKSITLLEKLNRTEEDLQGPRSF